VSRSDSLAALLKGATIVPVVIVDDSKTAVPLAKALVAGGVKVIEITLRTPAALDAIKAVADEVEGAIVGAGTVLNRGQYAAAEKAGARFMVSPGVGPEVLAAARDSAVPLMPGAATASEVMTLLDEGYGIQKFFPAGPAGGVAYLKALSSPIPQVRFCPTGGIDTKNARDYLALPNVIAIGGSWITPADAIKGGDFARIETLAREAAALGVKA